MAEYKDVAAIKTKIQKICDNCWHPYRLGGCPEHCGINDALKAIDSVPPAQSDGTDTNVGGNLIDRQAALDALDVLCQEHRYRIPGKRETYSQYNEAWQDALDRAEGAIGNLPSAQLGWIPITERLPEEETIYLITFGSGHVRLSSWHKDTKYNHGFDNIETGFLEDGTMVHFGVTAWMPLPKPYREGEKP